MILRSLYVSLVILTLSLFGTNRAAGQHYDIFLARPAAGSQTVVGGADVTGLAYDDVVCVFEVEMGAVGGEFVAAEPGVNHPNLNNPVNAYPSSAAGLEPGDVLSLEERDFTVDGNLEDLFFWNGMGAIAFIPAAADFRIDGGDPLASTAGAGGVFDDHPFLVVDSVALPGIYLASVNGTVAGFAPSDPVYLVMGTDGLITAEFLGISQEEFKMLSEEELDEALEEVIEMGVEYVETNLVVPEPASLALAALASCAIATMPCRRRKERFG